MSQSQATPNLPDTLPANYDFSQGAGQQAPQGQTQAPNPQASQTLPDTLPADYFDKKDNPPAGPRKTGEITNDVGQKVIVPKDGESFSDTMKRAVAYHKSLTPEQQLTRAQGRESRAVVRQSRLLPLRCNFASKLSVFVHRTACYALARCGHATPYRKSPSLPLVSSGL